MADERKDTARDGAIRRALALATEAQDLLDAHGGPPEAGVHLDLCRQALQQELGRNGLDKTSEQSG